MQKTNDNQLIEQYLKGDEKSLEFLIKKHLNSIYAFIYGYVKDQVEAEDIAQETFVKVWKNLKKFDRQKNFKSWLYTIAKHTALDHLKKRRTPVFSDFENEAGHNPLINGLADGSPLPNDFLEQRDLAEWLKSAVDKLSDKYRRIISLRHEEELSFREIAEQSGESIDTVKSRYRRGLIILKKILGKQY